LTGSNDFSSGGDRVSSKSDLTIEEHTGLCQTLLGTIMRITVEQSRANLTDAREVQSMTEREIEATTQEELRKVQVRRRQRIC